MGIGIQSTGNHIQGSIFAVVTYAAAGWSDLCRQKDMAALHSAQREALIAITGAYRTAPTQGLCVVGAAAPIDLVLEERRARYGIRKGSSVTFGGTTLGPEDESVRKKLKSELISQWQERWSSSERGRTTAAFFPDVKERLRAGNDWVRPDHWVTQVLTGHGAFNEYLAARTLRESAECECAGHRIDGVKHVLCECPEYEPQREVLNSVLGENVTWPAIARELVSAKTIYKVFGGFCQCVMMIKQATYL